MLFDIASALVLACLAVSLRAVPPCRSTRLGWAGIAAAAILVVSGRLLTDASTGLDLAAAALLIGVALSVGRELLVARTWPPGAFVVAVAVVTATGVYLRAHRLADIVASPSGSLQADVIYYQQQALKTANPCAAGDKSPLWPALNAPLVRTMHDRDLAMRIPSWVFGILMLPAVAWAIGRLFDPVVGIIVAGSLAVDSWLIDLCTQGLREELGVCLWMAVFVLLFAWRGLSWKWSPGAASLHGQTPGWHGQAAGWHGQAEPYSAELARGEQTEPALPHGQATAQSTGLCACPCRPGSPPVHAGRSPCHPDGPWQVSNARQSLSWGRALAAGAVSGVLLLLRNTDAPILMVLLAYGLIRARTPLPRTIVGLLLPLVIVAPFYVNQYRAYGDPFHLEKRDARYHANLEFHNRPAPPGLSMPSAEEYAKDLYAGRPLSPAAYLFRFHSLRETAANQWTGLKHVVMGEPFAADASLWLRLACAAGLIATLLRPPQRFASLFVVGSVLGIRAHLMATGLFEERLLLPVMVIWLAAGWWLMAAGVRAALKKGDAALSANRVCSPKKGR